MIVGKWQVIMSYAIDGFFFSSSASPLTPEPAMIPSHFEPVALSSQVRSCVIFVRQLSPISRIVAKINEYFSSSLPVMLFIIRV